MSKNNIMDIDRQTIRIVTSPSPVAVNTFFYAKEVGFIEAPVDFSAEFDPMDSFLLILVTNGKLRFEHGDEEIILSRGEIAFVDCSTRHRYEAGVDENCTFLYIYFNGKHTRDYYKLISAGNNISIFHVDDPERLISLMWQTINLYEKKNSTTEPIVSLNLTKILIEMCLMKNEEIPEDRSHPGFINVAYHYIGHHFKEKITLDILAKECGVNKFYLARESKSIRAKPLMTI